MATQIRHESWLELAARLGYTARGCVFAVVGVLAALAAVGNPSRAPDSKDALRTLLNQPFGEALLALIAAGLLCFAVWRLAQAVLDADRHGATPSSLLQRFAQAASALFYVAFAWVAISMIFGSEPKGSSDQMAHEWTAWLLEQPWGRWFVGAIGLGFLITGAGVAGRGLRADFKSRIETKEDKKKKEVVTALGVVGFLARGFVFAIIGLFFLFAAIHASSNEAKGFAGALRALQNYPYGRIVLGMTSAGFIAFGLFEIGQGAYRRIRLPRLAEHGSR
jgi:succinate dehydrogenase hydrophobic anchor subunit